VAVLDCAREDAGKIMEQLLASPFLAEKRMVVLENVLSATGKKDLQEEILSRIKEKRIPESNVVLFWEGEGKTKTDVSKKLHEVLSKEKFAQEFRELAGVQLSSWIRQEIEARGGIIDSQALSYMSTHVGGNMWSLNSLVDQLTNYTSSKITLGDVQLFLEEKFDDNIFNLVDAIVGKQPKQVFRMIQEQYSKGEDAQFIFAMILRQIRILVELRDLFEREDNLQSDAIAKRLNLHPFVVKKSLPLIKRYTLLQLQYIYQKLLELDIKTKTGQGGQSLLLDVLVGRISINI
jgi:DNA polymerase-3 subunit delta